MNIICDTCSVLMVIRLAPDMFIDQKFACVTINEVRKEIFRNQRFKSKYPWRDKFKSKVRALPGSRFQNNKFETLIETVRFINDSDGNLYGLSAVDQKIAACALFLEYGIATGDDGLIEFLSCEYAKKSVSCLEIVNNWIENDLIVWDDSRQKIIQDWDICREKPQPVEQAGRFQRLTGYRYVGP